MENLMGYRMLPAINTFPQFNRPMSILSPLDLSLRSSSVPITPPSTPSPPRKRTKHFEEHNIWRPHTMNFSAPFLGHRLGNPANIIATTTSTSSSPKTVNECFNDKSQIVDNDIAGQSINIFDDETIILPENDMDTSTDSNDEEYVDVLGNDDEEPPPPKIMLRNSNEEDTSLPKALTREKLIYEDEELHHKAMDGFAKLFMRDFKTDLSSVQLQMETNEPSNSGSTMPEHVKGSKTEKKRFKMRKQLSLDEDNTSPVSGTIIRKLRDDEELVVRKGDIDPAFNVVEITEEAKAILASIDNKIGAYLCQLCRTLYDDAFQLAQHRCPRIVHIEYKCSECEKVFNCPANLASHRRWHKPKTEIVGGHIRKQTSPEIDQSKSTAESEEPTIEGIFNCRQCGKSFRRQAYLKKHLASHQMLDSLNTMDAIKESSNAFSHDTTNYPFHHVNPIHPTQNHLIQATKIYPHPPPGIRFTNLFSNFDHRRFHALSDLYLSHHLDRSSAFQYVQNQNLRGIPIPQMIPPIMQMPVK